MSKSPDAFRTISEVADWLGVQAHVLRFWESRFTQVKPVKRAGGRRYYRPNDMRLLGGIKKLLHEDGITIKGVQRILREQGVAHVAALSQGLDEDARPDSVADDTVIPFSANSAPPAKQIRLDLDDSGAKPTDTNAHTEETTAGTPSITKSRDPELDAAPLMGGIASLAWNRSEFDDDLLSRIEPIARDLRRWLDRVEPHATG
ncbi:MerR family transcriptional regulator [Rhodobacteraceae bacterium B1Z28]|uniref:MerR family transcriptional regulator n=1 Tax=Ruegeria haliotis TaxID=2747601 RepID=A0ABX2PPC7_9RHOB|nr:MerR family transcriptional regulator [Ruegeria haliotis]NVO55531.1 MerR family transcriptional regulator [Ruegeria haliotis]